MKTLNMEEVCEGMITGKSLFNPSGRCLVSKGAVLTAPLIKSLKRHNIIKVHIKDIPEENDFSDDEIVMAEKICIKKIEEIFHEKPEDPMMKALFKAASRSKALEYLKCKKPG